MASILSASTVNCAAQRRGIEPDEATGAVHQRSAGKSRQHGNVGADVAFQPPAAAEPQGARHRGDDAERCHGSARSRPADGER